MSIWRRRVGDIIISRCGKGVKSTVKQAYASRGGSLCATRGTVVDSLSQCPLKSLARDNGAHCRPAFRVCGCPCERSEKSLPLSPGITSRPRGDRADKLANATCHRSANLAMKNGEALDSSETRTTIAPLHLHLFLIVPSLRERS